MILTDTHTHLYSESFNEDRNAMVQRALDNNITRFFIPAIDSTYTKAMYSLEKDFPSHVPVSYTHLTLPTTPYV